MPGDPKECRQRALNCLLLAKDATSEEARRTFLSLANTWTGLAAELEDAQALIDSINAIDTSGPTESQKQSSSGDGGLQPDHGGLQPDQ